MIQALFDGARFEFTDVFGERETIMLTVMTRRKEWLSTYNDTVRAGLERVVGTCKMQPRDHTEQFLILGYIQHESIGV